MQKQGPAQQSAIASFATSAQSPDKIRIYKVAGAIVGIYSVIMIWLNFAWYRLYPRSGFHWFDDRGEWIQIDKAVIFTAPILKLYGLTNCCAWTGLDNKHSALSAFFIGLGFETKSKYGMVFQPNGALHGAILTANLIGASLATIQYLVWEEQRIMCKFSYNPNE